MLVFIDLDGTLVKTTHPSWRPYRDGQAIIAPDKVPPLPGAREFISYCYQKGFILFSFPTPIPNTSNPFANILVFKVFAWLINPTLHGSMIISPSVRFFSKN
jgi:hypothetical protein